MLRNTFIFKAVAAAFAATMVVAMAASLGGINSSSVGADQSVVASCDTDGVTTSYTTAWDATDARDEITDVTVGGVSDTCDGQSMRVSLLDASDAVIGTGTLTIPVSGATSHAVALSTDPSAEDTTGVAIVIAG